MNRFASTINFAKLLFSSTRNFNGENVPGMSSLLRSLKILQGEHFIVQPSFDRPFFI